MATCSTTVYHVRTRDTYVSLVVSRVIFGETVLLVIGWGWLPRTAVIPTFGKPKNCHCGYNEEQCHNVGNVRVDVMLDTGSAVSLLHHKEAKMMNIHQILHSSPSIDYTHPLGSHYHSSPVLKGQCVDIQTMQ